MSPVLALLTQLSNDAMFSALFEQQMDQRNALEDRRCRGPDWRCCLWGCSDWARRLHAIEARTVVECQFDRKGPAVAGPPALCTGDRSGDLSSAYCRLHAQR